MKQMVVCFENNLRSSGEVVWSEEETLHDYVQVLVKSIAYGRDDVMEQAFEVIRFVMAHSKRALLEKLILKIVGPIIRISNYPLSQKQKINAMELLTQILR